MLTLVLAGIVTSLANASGQAGQANQLATER